MKIKMLSTFAAIFACLFLISIALNIKGYVVEQQNEAAVLSLKNMKYGSHTAFHRSLFSAVLPVKKTPLERSAPAQASETTILPEYRTLYGQNSDFAGWLIIPGTPIDYPVMQTPDRPNYYLKRDFTGGDSKYGTLYAAEGCNLKTPSDNITIYGHHMKDGQMFAALESYKDKKFYEQHNTIYFDTLTEKGVYQIVSVFKTVVYTANSFAYYRFINAENKDEFDAFMEKCNEFALYDTGKSAAYGDKLISLSTCEYSTKNGRLVVVAKKVSFDGE